MPTALRLCAPTSGPYSSRIRSEQPLMTAGCLVKFGGGIDHSEQPKPRGDPIQIPECPLQAPQDRQCREPGSEVALFGRELAPQLAQGRGQRSVGVLRTVPRNQRALAVQAHELKRQFHSRRRLQRGRQAQAERAQSIFDFGHGRGLLAVSRRLQDQGRTRHKNHPERIRRVRRRAWINQGKDWNARSGV